MANRVSTSDEAPLQASARICNPSDSCVALQPLSWLYCLLLHLSVFTVWVLFDSWVRRQALKPISLPDCSHAKTQEWTNTFACPEQKELLSDHQGYFMPSALSSGRHIPLSGWWQDDFVHLSFTTLLNCPKTFQASCDNEVNLYLSKVGHKLSFRRASRGKNKLTQASKRIPEDESGTGQGVCFIIKSMWIQLMARNVSPQYNFYLLWYCMMFHFSLN